MADDFAQTTTLWQKSVKRVLRVWQCLRQPLVCFVVQKTCLRGKRDLFCYCCLWGKRDLLTRQMRLLFRRQKRPTHTAKETYLHDRCDRCLRGKRDLLCYCYVRGKRDLLTRQKRPTYMAEETAETDLLTWRKSSWQKGSWDILACRIRYLYGR